MRNYFSSRLLEIYLHFAVSTLTICHVVIGMNSRLSGSTSNLAIAGRTSVSTPRSRGLSAGKTGLAGQRNGFVAKSWSDLSNAVNSTPSPRDSGRFSLHSMFAAF